MTNSEKSFICSVSCDKVKCNQSTVFFQVQSVKKYEQTHLFNAYTVFQVLRKKYYNRLRTNLQHSFTLAGSDTEAYFLI